MGGSSPVTGRGLRPHLLTGPEGFPEKSAFRMGGQVELTN
jgi:hypothetical protein